MRARPRWIGEDEATTTTCATRIALPSHVGRHYAFALPAPSTTSSKAPLSPRPAREAQPISSSAAALAEDVSTTAVHRPAAVTNRPHAAELLPTSAREPIDVDAARFIGATIRLFDVEVLVVQVALRVIGDRGEAPALVAAFQARFKRTIVLVAQDRRGIPTLFGPGPIALVLSRIPLEALTWQRYRYRPPRPMMLPIPIDPPREDSASDGYESIDANAYRTADNRQLGTPTRDLGRRTRTIPPHGDVSDRSEPGPVAAEHVAHRG